ncbi:hypothetical protein THAOC_23134 [Thalassiosira oceanica]|uniref:Uncharacterized protein n=1 Tax=Thalassiosira oceanica TaxID=159749 RepID=K0RST0_THAOC|nr:hypothetical protein THAOC_23134 [Thalassiosira oceanica]|eukprot:EJK56888.1 hypothetical protein THAOC_23134 [Thalassiosira oceanica]
MEYRLLSSRTTDEPRRGETAGVLLESIVGGRGAPPLAFSSDDEPRRTTAAREAGGSLLWAAEGARGGAKDMAGGASERSASESRAAIASKYRSADLPKPNSPPLAALSNRMSTHCRDDDVENSQKIPKASAEPSRVRYAKKARSQVGFLFFGSALRRNRRNREGGACKRERFEPRNTPPDTPY